MQQGMQPIQDVPEQQSTGQMGGGQMMGLALQDVETPEQERAADWIARATQVCGWCADQCIQEADPNMIECIRLCEDVTELGETALALLPRNSRFATNVLQTFAQAAEMCGQECGQHHHAHCQECAQVLGQTAEAVHRYLQSGGQMGTQFSQQTGQFTQGGGQFAQQQGATMGGM